MKQRRPSSASEASGLLCDGAIWPVHGSCGLFDEEWLAWDAEVREAGRAAIEKSVAAVRRTVRAVLAAALAALKERLHALLVDHLIDVGRQRVGLEAEVTQLDEVHERVLYEICDVVVRHLAGKVALEWRIVAIEQLARRGLVSGLPSYQQVPVRQTG